MGRLAIDDETFVLWVEYDELKSMENVQLQEIAIVPSQSMSPLANLQNSNSL